jgi:hypothetical protein
LERSVSDAQRARLWRDKQVAGGLGQLTCFGVVAILSLERGRTIEFVPKRRDFKTAGGLPERLAERATTWRTARAGPCLRCEVGGATAVGRPRCGLVRSLHGVKRAGEEDEWVFGGRDA